MSKPSSTSTTNWQEHDTEDVPAKRVKNYVWDGTDWVRATDSTSDSTKVDDAVFTPGTDVITMVGAEADDTTPDSVDEGDAGALRMSTNRNLYVRIRDNAGNERGLNVDGNGRISVTGAGTFTTGGVAAEDAALSGNPVRVGGRASYAEPTAMSADNDVVTTWLDRRGRQVIKQQAGTATLSNVSGSASSVTLLAANTSRLGATIFNDSTALLYVKFGATASTSSYTYKLYEDGCLEVPNGYTGVIDGIWASATGAARVTEMS